ncbi:MAG: glycosyltransferase [Patescibacteria group bacterium]
MNPKFSIGLVLFETKFLEQALPSLFAQKFESVEFLIRDHSSDFVASKLIEKNFPEIAKKAQIFRGENLWHSGGMNFLIGKSRGEFFVAASTDILYEPNFLKKAAKILHDPANKKVGVLGGKLKKWNAEKNARLEILDSAGIGATRAGRFFEIGGGQNSRKFSTEKIVFGISAALAIYRRAALEEVAVDGKFFDEKLHFKNDVDLAFRLNWLGWSAKFSPEIVAWHARGLGDAKSRRNRSAFERKNSMFGQFVVIAKNWDENFSLRTKIATKIRQLALRIFAFFAEPEKNGIRKFDAIQGELKPTPRKISAAEVEKLFT